MYFYGLFLGMTSFLSIGLFHPIVITCEYLFSYRIRPAFLSAGLILIEISLAVSDAIVSAVIGVIGFSCLWSIVELFQQHRRVERGWFPSNPRFHGPDHSSSKSSATGRAADQLKRAAEETGI